MPENKKFFFECVREYPEFFGIFDEFIGQLGQYLASRQCPAELALIFEKSTRCATLKAFGESFVLSFRFLGGHRQSLGVIDIEIDHRGEFQPLRSFFFNAEGQVGDEPEDVGNEDRSLRDAAFSDQLLDELAHQYFAWVRADLDLV